MVSETWPVVRLGDTCKKIGSGATPRGGKDVYLSGGIALIRSQNVYNNRFEPNGLAHISNEHADELAHVTVQEEDVLLNITGDSVARCCLAPSIVFPARVNQHVAIIRPDQSRLNARFLMYYLVSPLMQNHMLTIAGAGATRNALTKGMIENFKIAAPGLDVQRAIAHILGTLDDKIELNRQMSQTLEAIAQALFKSWFVDFEPFRDQGMQDSPLGEIPVGWRVGALGEICHIVMGQSPPGDTYNESGEGVSFYQGIRDFGFRFPTRRVYCTAPTRFAEKGDVLLSVRAPVGSLNIANEPCAVGRGIAALKLRAQHGSFLYYLLKANQSAWERFEAEGTVFGAVTKGDIHGFGTIIPPSEIIQRFNGVLEPVDGKIEFNERESNTLAAIRDTLLPKLLSGEIRVKDAEKFVESRL